MKIERVPPPTPPPQYALTFTRDESWTLIAALREYGDNHPQAVERDTWRAWAAELDKVVRS